MKQIQKGFTLIELMIVVAMFGILAAVAWPSVRSNWGYAIRAKVSELILQTSGFRTSISNKAEVDSTIGSAGVGLTVNIVGKVSGGSVNDTGTVVINGTTASTGANVTLTMTPTMTAGTLTWSCAGAPSKYFPASCR